MLLKLYIETANSKSVLNEALKFVSTFDGYCLHLLVLMLHSTETSILVEALNPLNT
jgi:hypothetical protein